MVAAITMERTDPLGAHERFLLAGEGFDIFLQAVPAGPRFRDLVGGIMSIACHLLSCRGLPGAHRDCCGCSAGFQSLDYACRLHTDDRVAARSAKKTQFASPSVLWRGPWPKARTRGVFRKRSISTKQTAVIAVANKTARIHLATKRQASRWHGTSPGWCVIPNPLGANARACYRAGPDLKSGTQHQRCAPTDDMEHLTLAEMLARRRAVAEPGAELVPARHDTASSEYEQLEILSQAAEVREGPPRRMRERAGSPASSAAGEGRERAHRAMSVTDGCARVYVSRSGGRVKKKIWKQVTMP